MPSTNHRDGICDHTEKLPEYLKMLAQGAPQFPGMDAL